MFVDADEPCAQATFNFGVATFTRQYDIKVNKKLFSLFENSSILLSQKCFSGSFAMFRSCNLNNIEAFVTPNTNM